jgi:hypothetical protein
MRKIPPKSVHREKPKLDNDEILLNICDTRKRHVSLTLGAGRYRVIPMPAGALEALSKLRCNECPTRLFQPILSGGPSHGLIMVIQTAENN